MNGIIMKDSVVNGIVPKDHKDISNKDIASPKKDEMTNGSCCTSDNKGDSALAKLNLINPFVHSLAPETALEKFQTTVNSVLLAPLRVLGIIIFLLLTWAMACIGLYGMSQEDIARKPLSGWRKNCQSIARLLMRGVFLSGTVHWVKIIGKKASAKEAPIVVVAPHSSFYDSLVAVITSPPSVVAKAETASLPFFGKIINLTQPIYVCREDPNSRLTTIQGIKDRANSTEDWPPLMIFPEGTCTNRQALISFKLGAFYPGVPIQPIIIRYPNRYDSFTWTWAGPGPLQLLWRTLTKGFSNVEVEYLPVYVPSEEEKQNPKMYAKNVQKVMSKALEMRISEYTYNDCKTLARAKDLSLPKFLSSAEVEKLRQAIGLNRTNIEEKIVTSSLVNEANYRLNYAGFCLRLQIPQDELSQRLFEIFQDKTENTKQQQLKEDTEEVLIDFREYLLSALFIIKFKQPAIQLIKLAFKMYGGAISKETFTKNICGLLGRKKLPEAQDADILFDEIKKSSEDKVTFDEFSVYAEQKPKYSYLFAPPKEYAP